MFISNRGGIREVVNRKTTHKKTTKTILLKKTTTTRFVEPQNCRYKLKEPKIMGDHITTNPYNPIQIIILCKVPESVCVSIHS